MAGTLSGAFSTLVKLVPSAISAATAAGRIMAVTELPREDRSQDAMAEELLQANRTAGVEVAVEALDFAYRGGGPVFRDAAIHAGPGEIVALVGPSGEGKTTMLRLLLGIVLPQKGAVRLRGLSTGETLAASASTRRLFSYVPQGNTMFAGTVGENLRIMNPTATDKMLWNALELACAGDFVRRMPKGLDSPILEGGGGLSQGQVQRLSIARAILADAPVLLLDEATSALDVATERKVLRNVLTAQRHKTILVTTHRPSVLSICTRVYQIAGGSVTPMTQEEIQKKIADF